MTSSPRLVKEEEEEEEDEERKKEEERRRGRRKEERKKKKKRRRRKKVKKKKEEEEKTRRKRRRKKKTKKKGEQASGLLALCIGEIRKLCTARPLQPKMGGGYLQLLGWWSAASLFFSISEMFGLSCATTRADNVVVTLKTFRWLLGRLAAPRKRTAPEK